MDYDLALGFVILSAFACVIAIGCFGFGYALGFNAGCERMTKELHPN